jgi:hypothetical protein
VKEKDMKNENRSAAARPTAASRAARPARMGAAQLPECLVSLAAPIAPAAARGRIEPNAFSRAEMREIVLEMIG